MAFPKIVIAGGSGFLGRPLCRALWDNGKREIFALTRSWPEIPYARVVRWDGRSPGPWQECLEGASALINLCGEPPAPVKITPERRARVERSRLDPARALTAALRSARRPPPVFISASSVAFYGDRGDEAVDEASGPGEDAPAALCADWERQALGAPGVTRTVLLRMGHVVGEGFGALRPLLLPFRLGLGGPVGDGLQWMPWVSREDLIGLILHLIETEVAGPVNAVAPEPVTNGDFSSALAAALRRPSKMRYPTRVAELAFGELGESLLAGQRAFPRRALESGYAFKRPGLAETLAAALR